MDSILNINIHNNNIIDSETTREYANIKSSFFRLLLFVFIGSIFFDDPNLFLWKRLTYSVFLYLSLWELIVIYYNFKRFGLQLPSLVKNFFGLYIAFIIVGLVRCFFSPNFNLVTIFNNPNALLAAIPVFAFGVGFYSSKEDIFKILQIVCISFLVFFFPNPFSKISFYPGYVCSTAIIPAFIFSFNIKKGRIFYSSLIVLALVFSYFSDYRVISLNVILFLGLFIVLNLFRKAHVVKSLILGVVFVFTYLMITNFEYCVESFGRLIGKNNLEIDDTRTFLFKELFDDLKPQEYFFGKGFLGTYFSEYFFILQKNGDSSGDFYERYTVEVGFLELILKGGYVFVFLYLIPLIFTSIKGIFSRKISPLTFNLCIYLIVGVVTMFFEYMPAYGFNFFLLFFIAGFVYRDLADSKNIIYVENDSPDMITQQSV